VQSTAKRNAAPEGEVARLIDKEPVVDKEPAPTPAAQTRGEVTKNESAVAATSASASLPAGQQAVVTPTTSPRAVTSHQDAVDLLLHRPSKRGSRKWNFVAMSLLVLLSAQIVHHFSQDLASSPRFGPPVIAIYGSLGLDLAPRWRLRDYEVRQWGVLSNPKQPGTLRVRASITNRAPFAQPYPLLKLVLEDRFGQQVQARAFKPDEYLEATLEPGKRLSPNDRIDANLTIVDPGAAAEGFRFDVCLRQANNLLCADDQRLP
jgi:hypothetical protein